MASTQLSLDTTGSGHLLRDYKLTGGVQQLVHMSSCHNITIIMDNSSGQLVLMRDNQELFRADIMSITALVSATPALRFTELANLMVT